MLWLWDLPIEDLSVLVPVYTVTGILLMLVVTGLVRPRPTRWAVGWAVLGAAIGAAAGWLAVWFVVDVQDTFGAPASAVIRCGMTVCGAAVGVACVAAVRGGRWRRALAVLSIASVVISGALLVNRDVAYYPRLGDAVGATGAPRLQLHPNRSAATATAGRVGTVRIPAPVSDFHARDAWVYVPPAALRPHPPRLPVMVLMAGQPGGPADAFVAGQLRTVLDRVAARNGGIAPIVVVPDQLGAYNVNPMCVDSAMGHVDTYVTVDVRRWIERRLPVAHDRRDWAVGGFSEGATCAVQFATSHPELYGSSIAVSPELGPFDGSLARTLREGFDGRLATWRAAQPIATMRRHGDYPGMTAVYAVGANDHRYGAVAPKLAAASRAAGMTVVFRRLPGLAHNWNTGAAGLAYGIAALLPRWGLR